MSQVSTNLQLKLEQVPDDDAVLTGTYINDQSGYASTSNMQKIDAFAGNTTNEITLIKGVGWTNQTITGNATAITQVNSRITYPVNVTGTNTLVGTVSQITGAPLNDSNLKVYPSVANTSSVTMSINGETALPVVKVQNQTGSTVYAPLSAGDLQPNNPVLIGKSPDGIRYILIGAENFARNVYLQNGTNNFVNLQTGIGILPSLNTTDKTSIVNAINENLLRAQNYMNRQAIIDGGFQVAQANPIIGTAVNNPITGSYPIFDMWRTSNNSDSGIFPTVSHSQQNLIGVVNNATKCKRIQVSGAGTSLGANSFYIDQQSIENGTVGLCGLDKKITVSFYAKSTIPNKKIGISLIQNYGTGGTVSPNERLNGKNFTLTTQFQKFEFTFTTNDIISKNFGSNKDDVLILEIWHVWGDNFKTIVDSPNSESFVGAGNIEYTAVQLNSGDKSLEFELESFETVLKKCQRYYEKSFVYLDTVPSSTNSGSYNNYIYSYNPFSVKANVRFNTTKRIPLALGSGLKIYDISGNENKIYLNAVNQPIGGGFSSDNNFTIFSNAVPSANIYEIAFHWVADARF